MMIVLFMVAVTNPDKIFIEPSRLEKYVTIFELTNNIPYFVYYLFIKRVLARSKKQFDTYLPRLQSKYENDHGQKVSFTINDTHGDRMQFVRDNLDYSQNIINFGCGEFRHEKYWGKKLDKEVELISYDVEDYSELQKVFEDRLMCNWSFTNDLNTIDKTKEYQLVCSEVIEHDEKCLDQLKELISTHNITKVIITTPNKDFNQYYNLGDEEVRRDDHFIEYTENEFKQLMSNNFTNPEFYKIGDCVDDVCVTSACIIKTK